MSAPKKTNRKKTAARRTTAKKTQSKGARGPNITKSKAWQAAEWEYSEIHSRALMPMFGEPLTSQEIIERCGSILKKCPAFYPARLEIALRRLAQGADADAERQMDEGLQTLLELSPPDHLEKELEALMENLEKISRFDLSKRYLEGLIARYPASPDFRDSLALAEAHLGDFDAALRHITEAVEMAPDKHHFQSNLGWIHLLAGNLPEASVALAEALRLAPDNEVAKGNLEVHRYLSQHGGNFADYLLRPADREELARLVDQEDWDRADALRESYNRCRTDAMALILSRETDRIARLHDLLATHKTFFEFVHRVNQDEYVLDEDIGFTEANFEPIMHKFIFKFHDVDRKMIDEIYESLFAYYGFLTQHGLVELEDFEEFRETLLDVKEELIQKMERYNEIRHDDGLNEEEKESIREELFEGDHAWPFL